MSQIWTKAKIESTNERDTIPSMEVLPLRIDNWQTDRLGVKMLGGQHAGTSYRQVDRPKKYFFECQKAIEYLFPYIISTIQ